MRPLKLVYYGDPRLRQKAEELKEIPPELPEIVKEMDALALKSNGAGLAGPQVGLPWRFFIIHEEIEVSPGQWQMGPLQVVINPVLSNPGDKIIVYDEGCLSLPGIRGPVPRPCSITVDGLDLEGKPFHKELFGYPARQYMHENDHLNGVLYIDRMSKADREALEPKLRAVKKKYCS